MSYQGQASITLIDVSDGASGTTYYTHIFYSSTSSPESASDVSDNPAGKQYIGIQSTTSSTPPAWNDPGWVWEKYIGDTGQTGVSVTSVKEVYYLKTNESSPPALINGQAVTSSSTGSNVWTTVVPTYVTGGVYYMSIQTSLDRGTSPVFSEIILNQGLTDSNSNATEAVGAVRAQNQHFWFLSSPISTTHPAGAYITDESIDSFKNTKQGGYLLARSDGLEFGQGAIKFVDLIVDSQGSNTALTFYKPDGLTEAATLTANGLVLKNGGIVAGTPNNSGYIYLSTEDYPLKNSSTSTPGLTINEHTPTATGTDGRTVDDSAWRAIIGTQFGVTADGSLYASNVDLSGRLYLPNAGMVSDNVLPENIDLIENPYIHLSQEIESSSFDIEETLHSDFINFYNIFGNNNGYAVLKIEELYYLISVTPSVTSGEVYKYSISFPTSFSGFPVDEIQSVYNITLEALSSAFSSNIPIGSFIYKMPDTFLGHVIRFWAGQDPAYKTTAPFIITQEGSLYANNGYFKGTVVSNNAILGQDNGIGGTTDYIRVMMGTEGLTSIEIQSKQLDNRFNELNTSLRSYTDNQITAAKTYVDEQIGITNNRVIITENDLSVLRQYITFPPDIVASYTELRSNGNVTLRLTDNFLSIRNNSLGTSQPNDPILTYWEDKMQINQYGIVIGSFGWVRADSGNLQLKKVR